MEDILYSASILNHITVKDLIENRSSILVLNKFIEQFSGQKFSYAKDQDLAEALSKNLMKNARQIRLKSLTILKQFEVMTFVEAD